MLGSLDTVGCVGSVVGTSVVDAATALVATADVVVGATPVPGTGFCNAVQ